MVSYYLNMLLIASPFQEYSCLLI